MKRRLFEVESDCLFIVQRLREIDESYFVMFNLDTKKFELHSHAQKKKTYCLTFPFETLDERALVLARKTRVENSDKIFEEMERQNKLLQEKAQRQILNNFKEKLYES